MTNSRQPAVLVTGGAGFLGAHVVRGLLADHRYDDFRVIVVDDLSGGFEENLPENPRVAFIRASVDDETKIESLFHGNDIRYIFHLAAYAAEGLSHFIRRFNYQNNLIGSVNLINAAVRHEVEHFVFTSSIAVYGSGQVPMVEATTPTPEDPYGVAKYAVELDLKCAAEMFGLRFTVFRPHNVYGEFQNIGDRYRNVVGIFMNRLLQKQSLPVFGDGSQKRAFTYVQDLIQPFLDSPFLDAARNEVFNVGSDTPTTVRELAEIVASEFDVEANVELLEARNEVHLAWSDHSKARDVFGDESETSLREGIRRMAAWVRTVGARSSTTFENIELTRNLPASWRVAE